MREFSIDLESQRNGVYIPVKLFLCVYQNVTDKEYLEVKDTLSREEQLEYSAFQVEKRRTEFLFGRYAGKRASSDLIGELDLKNISITRGVFHQPVLICKKNKENIQVSLTHTNKIAASIAFPERHPFSIDLEHIEESNVEYLSSFIESSDVRLFQYFGKSKIQIYTLIWSAKEALSKVLKTGFTVSTIIYDLQSVKDHEGVYTIEFKHFSQYKVVGFRIGSYMCSICLPKNTKLTIEQTSKNKLEEYLISKQYSAM